MVKTINFVLCVFYRDNKIGEKYGLKKAKTQDTELKDYGVSE